MTKQELKEYRAAKLELQLIEKELTLFRTVADSTKGSMQEYPYILHTIQIEGITPSVAKMLNARRTELIRKRKTVERFLVKVDDPHKSSLIRLRYLDGLSWAEVAIRAGGGNTEEGVKQAVHRFLKKTESCHECHENTC